MNAAFGTDYIRSEFERIGQQLETPVTVYLIGGGAMAFRDLKNATKDIDLVVESGEALDRLQSTLLELDYAVVHAPAAEYEALGAQRILENDDGCRIDLFNRQVIDKMVLSEGIRGRSDRYLETEYLHVKLVSPEDIFLFKAVAGRAGDIEDMFALLQTDLDFSVIEAELSDQIELLDQELFVTHVNEALVDLTDQYNVTTPLHEPVAEITDRVYEEVEVLLALEEPTSIAELHQELDRTEGELRAILDRLEAKDAVTVNGDIVERLTDTI